MTQIKSLQSIASQVDDGTTTAIRENILLRRINNSLRKQRDALHSELKELREHLDSERRISNAMALDLAKTVEVLGGDEHDLAPELARELSDNLQKALGCLADIGICTDMDLATIKSKALRIYNEIQSDFEVAEEAENADPVAQPQDEAEPVITDHEGRPMAYWGGKAKAKQAVPDKKKINPLEHTKTKIYKRGWNDCRDAMLEAPQPESVAPDDLPYWPPCNPGCDPEFNGCRSAGCADLCKPARDAMLSQSPTLKSQRSRLFELMEKGFMTCNSDGANKKYWVSVNFKELKDAQDFHRSLINLAVTEGGK